MPKKKAANLFATSHVLNNCQPLSEPGSDPSSSGGVLAWPFLAWAGLGWPCGQLGFCVRVNNQCPTRIKTIRINF